MMNDQNDNVINLINHLKSAEQTLVDQSTTSPVDMNPSYFKKISSFILDFIFVLVIKAFITISYASFIHEYMFMLNEEQKMALVNADMTFHFSIMVLVYYCYFLFCNYTLNGKTLGKKIFSITTINDEFIFNNKSSDNSLSLAQANRRAFGYLLCYISFGTFFIFSFFSEDKRGLQDFFSSSRTVNDEWIKFIIDYKQFGTEVITIDILELERAA